MTTDSLFSGVLTFSLLAAGALAFGQDAATSQYAAVPQAAVTLPMVTVIGHRLPADATAPRTYSASAEQARAAKHSGVAV